MLKTLLCPLTKYIFRIPAKTVETNHSAAAYSEFRILPILNPIYYHPYLFFSRVEKGFIRLSEGTRVLTFKWLKGKGL